MPSAKQQRLRTRNARHLILIAVTERKYILILGRPTSLVSNSGILHTGSRSVFSDLVRVKSNVSPRLSNPTYHSIFDRITP